MARSTKRQSKKDADSPPDDSSKRQSKKDADSPPDDSSKTLVEALMDDDEVVVDGFQRLSVLGLEVMTFDGPVRVRTLENPEEEH